jgi:hypothetical protein
MIGTIKIYPEFKKFALEKGYDANTPTMEIYNIPERKITYRKEIK